MAVLFGEEGHASKGRPPGVRNRITRHLKDAILLAAAEIGDVDMYIKDPEGPIVKRGQLMGYLRWLAVNYPKSYAVMLARLIPLQITGELDLAPRAFNSKADLIEEMERRGLPTGPLLSLTLPERKPDEAPQYPDDLGSNNDDEQSCLVDGRSGAD